MMVLDVVVVIRVPCMSHQRLENIWNGEIEKCVLFRQHAAVMAMVVHHDSKWPSVPRSHDPVAYGVRVREMEEEIQRARNRSCEVKECVCEEHHVCFVSNHGLSPSDVGLKNRSVEEDRKVNVLEVPSRKDCRLEVCALFVV